MKQINLESSFFRFSIGDIFEVKDKPYIYVAGRIDKGQIGSQISVAITDAFGNIQDRTIILGADWFCRSKSISTVATEGMNVVLLCKKEDKLKLSKGVYLTSSNKSPASNTKSIKQ